MLSFLRMFQKAKPYSKFAQIYDYIMRHVNYAEWAEYIYSVLTKYGIDSGNFLDISCGTGSFLMEFKRYGFTINGSDFSPSMIEIAKSKHKDSGKEDIFFVRDMKNLTFDKRFDGIVSLFDSLNYLMVQEDVHKNLKSVSSILKDKGIYIFDICTEYNSIRNFDNYIERGEYIGLNYIRKSYYNKDERIQINDIKIIDKENGNQYREIHKQRIYTQEEMIQIIELSPLKLLAIYDDFTSNPPTDETERIHFILKKE